MPDVFPCDWDISWYELYRKKDEKMEMWDGGYSSSSNDIIDADYDGPVLTGREYLKMSHHQRREYEKKLFAQIDRYKNKQRALDRTVSAFDIAIDLKNQMEWNSLMDYSSMDQIDIENLAEKLRIKRFDLEKEIENHDESVTAEYIYRYNGGKRYGSDFALKTGYLLEWRKQQKGREFTQKDLEIQLSKIDNKLITSEIIGCSKIMNFDRVVGFKILTMTEAYKEMKGKVYLTLDEIADAMDAIDRNKTERLNAVAIATEKLANDLNQTKTIKSKTQDLQNKNYTTSATIYGMPLSKNNDPFFYMEKVNSIHKLIEYIEEHKMYNHVFDADRVNVKYVSEVVEVYQKILEPKERDRNILIEALDHIENHLKRVIENYKEKRSDDLEIYRNFLGMRFNFKSLF